jgi:hypothetical protein
MSVDDVIKKYIPKVESAVAKNRELLFKIMWPKRSRAYKAGWEWAKRLVK